LIEWLRELINLRELTIAGYNIGVAAVVGALIGWVYRRTRSDVLTPPRFVHNLIGVAMITAMVIMVISGNLVLTLGLVGALSIVRFRTPIKDPRDIVFLFWAIAGGLAAGSGAHGVLIVASVLIALMFLVLAQGIPWVRANPAYLVVLRGEDLPESEIENIVRSVSSRFRIRQKSATDSNVELIYEIDLSNGDGAALLSRLRPLAPAATINLLSYSGESAL
jgi:uncharacterized membrane protein YhiD involved in acid resistance